MINEDKQREQLEHLLEALEFLKEDEKHDVIDGLVGEVQARISIVRDKEDEYAKQLLKNLDLWTEPAKEAFEVS